MEIPAPASSARRVMTFRRFFFGNVRFCDSNVLVSMNFHLLFYVGNSTGILGA
jgi:hypothetical protein